MASFLTKVTSQGQVTIPVELRRLLDVEQGSMLEWTVENDVVRVERRKLYTFEDMHRALFPEGPPPYVSDEELNASKAAYAAEKYVDLKQGSRGRR